jgi:GxxExxY protein
MGKCSNCHQDGHTIRSCPTKPEVNDETVLLVLEEDVIEKFKCIVGMANEVSKELRKGFSESVYEEALCIELQMKGIQYSTQEILPITYKNRYVGQNRLDIILQTWLHVIIELKATSTAIKADERWQVVRYMSRKECPYGVVINFTQSTNGGVELAFIVRQDGYYYAYNLETSTGIKMLDYT